MVLLTRDIVVFVLLVELENNAKKVWAEFELKLSGSGSEWRLNSYWRGFENFPTLSKGSSHIGRFHSRGQHLCKFIGTKESVCIRKQLNSQRIGLGHQHGRRFIVLGHQYGHRDVMWKRSIPMYLAKCEHAGATFFCLYLGLCEANLQAPAKCVRGRHFGMSGMPSKGYPGKPRGTQKS